MKTLLIFLLILSCSSSRPKQTIDRNIATPTPKNMTIFRGQLKLVPIDYLDTGTIVKCGNEKLKIQNLEGRNTLVLMESYFSKRKAYQCLTLAPDPKLIADVKVVNRNFTEEKLSVAPRRVTLSKKDQQRAWREQQMLNKIYASSKNEFLFHSSFMKPLNSFITSHYGVRRTYNGHHKGQHLGTDFRAAVGVKIPVTNDGKVVYSGDLFYTGHTVIVDHGMDIFSVYGHLSKRYVQSGDYIKKGDIVGEAGATGRVTGPHLHWGIKVRGQYVDGVLVVKNSQEFFN